jgi:hypothetical protein
MEKRVISTSLYGRVSCEACRRPPASGSRVDLPRSNLGQTSRVGATLLPAQVIRIGKRLNGVGHVPSPLVGRLAQGAAACFTIKVREIAARLPDDDIAAAMNQAGYRSATGNEFTTSKIRWIRHRYQIPSAPCHQPGELTVQQVADRFGVSGNVVYYWIETGVVSAFRRNLGSPYRIALTDDKVAELEQWVRNSTRIARIRSSTSQKLIAAGAL